MKESILKRSARRIASKFSSLLLVNNGAYWDRYALFWKLSGEGKKYRFLGEEWKGHEKFVSLLQKYSSGKQTALEIGCGGGKITYEGIKLFKKIYAADVSTRMIKYAKKSLAHNDSVTFLKIDGFTLKEIPHSSIDVVYSHDVFVHFSNLQVYTYLREIFRVLRPHGIAIISFYSFFHHFDLFKEMSLKYWSQKQYPPHMRVHFTTAEMVRRMAQDVGLAEVEMDTQHFLIAVLEKKSNTSVET